MESYMPYVRVITETKPANCSPSFRWVLPDTYIASHRKKYYEDVGLILSSTFSFKDSNNQICSANTSNMRLLTSTFANQESYLKWMNDPIRKIFSSEKTKYYESYKIERNITYNDI